MFIFNRKTEKGRLSTGKVSFGRNMYKKNEKKESKQIERSIKAKGLLF